MPNQNKVRGSEMTTKQLIRLKIVLDFGTKKNIANSKYRTQFFKETIGFQSPNFYSENSIYFI